MPSPHTATRGWRRWTPAIVVLAVAGSMGLLLVVVASCGAVTARVGAAPTATLNKVQIGNEMMATQQAMAREDGPKKTVITSPNTAPTPSSCPMFQQAHTGIEPWDGMVVSGYITNMATIFPGAGGHIEYVVYAGALMSNAQQGVLIVFQQPTDPCAHPEPTSLTYYDTPYQKGALTLTQINATSVSFSIADGGTGQFNFVTNQFS